MYSIGFLMALATIFNFLVPVFLQNCNYYQELVYGNTYFIYNQEYPNYYTPPVNCRWMGISPPNTNIELICDIDIPSTNNCIDGALTISLTGDLSLNDGRRYCGTGKISLMTDSNDFTMSLTSPFYSQRGRFSCNVKAIVCNCGWKFGTRIVGGNETGINEFPFMAGIISVSRKTVVCGGSIISTKHILTAAHCVYDREPEELAILVGDHNIILANDTDATRLYRSKNFIIHDDFILKDYTNDIAIIVTEKYIEFNMKVGPICLPFKYEDVDFTGAPVTILGWGVTDYTGPQSDVLLEANVTVISNDECAQKNIVPITYNNICTYAINKDACAGDSGGPVLWNNKSKHILFLLGIISQGRLCATSSPGINMRVTSYLSWIEQNTNYLFCKK